MLTSFKIFKITVSEWSLSITRRIKTPEPEQISTTLDKIFGTRPFSKEYGLFHWFSTSITLILPPFTPKTMLVVEQDNFCSKQHCNGGEEGIDNSRTVPIYFVQDCSYKPKKVV